MKHNYDSGKRHHPLTVGEKVYDANVMLVGTIVAIKGQMVYLEMLGNDEQENKKMFDEEITEADCKWKSHAENIYQFADGLVGRDGNPVCYEHMETEDEYPYYSPYLDENLFEFETEKVEKLNEMEKKPTVEEIARIAEGLVIALGEIQNDMRRGNEPPTEEEIDALYEEASKINEYFNG